MRDVLRRAGYEMILVDECRATASCSGCKQEDSECTEARKEGRKIRGLLVCKTRSKLGTRDYNATRNTTQAVGEDLNNDETPSCLSRIKGPQRSL